MSADSGEVSFVDTNVLVYALAADDPQRSSTAQRLLAELLEKNTFRTSTQVFQELFVTLTRKVRTPLQPAEVMRYVDHLAAWPITVLDYPAVRSGMELAEQARLSLWDALVIVAAARAGATQLFTEDLQDGQTLLGVWIRNPFRASPGSDSH